MTSNSTLGGDRRDRRPRPRVPALPASPGRALAASPDRAPAGSPGQAPAGSPGRALPASPGRAPVVSPGRAPVVSPGRAPAGSPGRAPGRAPAGSSGRAPASSPARTPAFRRGQLDGLPLIAGYLPFALVLGATVASSSVPDLAGWATSPLIFAGAAQLALIDLVDAGAGAVVVVATALVINLRHVMYSGGLAPWFRDEGMAWRLFAPFVLTDPQYSLVTSRFPELPSAPERRAYYLGLALTLWPAWMVMTAVGVVVGAVMPTGLSLDLAVPLTFLALLVPTLTDRPTLAAALVGGAVAVAARGAPLHLGLLIGALAGIAAGVLLDEEVRT